MNHEVNSSMKDFSRLFDGIKTFDIREASAAYQFGESITYKEWDSEKHETSEKPKGHTGREITFRIGFIQILSSSEVVLSLLPIKAKPSKG